MYYQIIIIIYYHNNKQKTVQNKIQTRRGEELSVS